MPWPFRPARIIMIPDARSSQPGAFERVASPLFPKDDLSVKLDWSVIWEFMGLCENVRLSTSGRPPCGLAHTSVGRTRSLLRRPLRGVGEPDGDKAPNPLAERSRKLRLCRGDQGFNSNSKSSRTRLAALSQMLTSCAFPFPTNRPSTPRAATEHHRAELPARSHRLHLMLQNFRC